MDIFKYKVGTNIEYFIKDTHKTFWVFVDTIKPDDVRMWAMNLGAYEVPAEAEESSFLDILVLSGLTEDLITGLFAELAFGIVVSFCKGNIHQKVDVLAKITPKDLMN